MEKIIKILMDRDGLDYEEAKSIVEETQEMILNADAMEADQIMAEQLGLEPDYLFDLLAL